MNLGKSQEPLAVNKDDPNGDDKINKEDELNDEKEGSSDDKKGSKMENVRDSV